MKKVISILMIVFIAALPMPVLAEEDITEEDKTNLTYQFLGGAAANQNVSIKAEDIDTVKGLLWQDIEDMNLIDKIGNTTAQLASSIRLTVDTFKNGIMNIDVDKNKMFNQILEHGKIIYGIGPQDEKQITRIQNPDGANGIRLKTKALTEQYNSATQATIELAEINPNSQAMTAINLQDRAGYEKDIGRSDIFANTDGTYYIHFNGIIQAWKGTNNTNENITVELSGGDTRGDYRNAIYKFRPGNENAYYTLLRRLEEADGIGIHFGFIDSEGNNVNIGANGSKTNVGTATLTIEPGYSGIAFTQNIKGFTSKKEVIATRYDQHNTRFTFLNNYTGELTIHENGDEPSETRITYKQPYTNASNMGMLFIAAYDPLPTIKVGDQTQTTTAINIETTANAEGQGKTPQAAYNNNYYQNITVAGAAQDYYWSDYTDALNNEITTIGTTIEGYQTEIIDKYTQQEVRIKEINQQNNAYYTGQQENLNTGEQEKVDTLLQNENTLHQMTEENQNTINNGFSSQGIGINNPFKNFSSSKFLTSANGVKTQLTRMLNTKIGILTEIALILGILALIIGKI